MANLSENINNEMIQEGVSTNQEQISGNVQENIQPSNGMSEDEMREDLDRMFADLGVKEAEYNSNRLSVINKIKDMKITFLNKIFKLLMDSGIDPMDQASFGKFISDLEYQDPDLAILFESLFDNADPESVSFKAAGISGNTEDKSEQPQETQNNEGLSIQENNTPINPQVGEISKNIRNLNNLPNINV